MCIEMANLLICVPFVTITSFEPFVTFVLFVKAHFLFKHIVLCLLFVLFVPAHFVIVLSHVYIPTHVVWVSFRLCIRTGPILIRIFNRKGKNRSCFWLYDF